MTLAIGKPMTLADYLDYDDGTDARYELVDGILVSMGAESDINVVIGSFLFSVLLKFAPFYCIRRGTEIEVTGGKANTRYPDLMVLTEASAAALAGKKRSLITLDMPVPALVVEAVSSSDTDRPSRERDYVDKRREYAQRGIPEYWIVDVISKVVLVLRLVNGQYEEERFVGAETLRSAVFPELSLSAAEILTAGPAFNQSLKPPASPA